MDIKESLDLLHEMFKDKDWYDSVDVEEFGRLAVYCKYLGLEVWNCIPDKLGDRYVLTRFAASKPNKPAAAVAPTPQVEPLIPELEEYAEEKTPDVATLVKQLERLEKICGSNILQDIFYEVHDGRNAVTNLRVRYPEVAQPMEELYQTYGFDVIYEELDG